MCPVKSQTVCTWNIPQGLSTYIKGEKTQKIKNKKLLDFGLLQAKRATALCWKSVDAPSLGMWIKELSNCIG